MTTKHIPQRALAPMKRLIAVGLVVTIGFIGICMTVLWNSGARDKEQARKSAINLVSTISSEIMRNFELYDLSVQAVVEGLSLPELSQLSPKLRQLLFFDRAASAKDMGSIFVLDTAGTVVMDSLTLKPHPDNYAQSDFFKVQQDRNAGPYLSKPWVDRNGVYLIGLSRRLTAADGSFRGVVVGTMRLSYFHNILRKLKLGEQDAVTLLREDGSVVMRNPFDIEIINRDLSRSAIFKKISGMSAGTFQAVAGIDGIERLYAFQRIGEQPFYVAYGQSVESIYAGWRQEAWRVGLVMFALCATNIALIIFLACGLKRRAEAEYELAIIATTDSLTGLHNRRRLDEVFYQEWRRALRIQKPVALLMIDADQFKAYNDQFGHQDGDTALQAIAQCISVGSRRASDLSVRYGGEEFAVLLPETTIEQALEVAEKIRKNVLSMRTDQFGRPGSTPTVSIGVASMVPRQGLEPSDLVKAADNALYEAKAAGRNRSIAAIIRLLDPGAIAA